MGLGFRGRFEGFFFFGFWVLEKSGAVARECGVLRMRPRPSLRSVHTRFMLSYMILYMISCMV
jgi:hypothetical protein